MLLIIQQGYVCIVVATIMSTVYIVFARFDLLSFYRKERFIRPAVEKLKSFTKILNADIVQLFFERTANRSVVSLSSTAKVCCFSLAVVLIIPGSAFLLFLSILRKVFFNLLIGWKGMCLGSLSSMFETFIKLVQQLTGPLHIPLYLVRAVFFPFNLLCKLADLFNIEGLYNLLTVTCQGAKSPIELFVDSFVLGVAILFIKSDYNFLWAIAFQEMNRSLVLKFWLEIKTLFSLNFVIAGIVLLFSSSNPFIIMLRFFLSYVNFAAFFERDNVTHVISTACIGIEGFQNQELILVDATSILVWLLIAPMFYSAAEIVCPNGGYATTTTTASVAPIQEQAMLQDDGHNSTSSRGNSYELSSIDMDSILFSDCNSIGEMNDSQEGSAQRSMESIEENLLHLEDEDDDGSELSELNGINININDNHHETSPHNSERSTTEADGMLQNAHQLAGDMNSGTSVVLLSTAQASNLRISNGLFRYASSNVSFALSADLVIVYAIIAYLSRCQKNDSLSKLRKLRSHHRWDMQTIRQSIERFQVERLTRRSSRNRFVRFRTRVLTAIREEEDRAANTLSHSTNETDMTKLPPYYRLCFTVQKELYETLQILYILRRIRISTPLSYVLAFLGFGHALTIVGRKMWAVVMRKYTIFFRACLGIWTNETEKAYGVEKLVKDFTLREPDEATLEFLKLTIASRVILLQALGATTTLISIIVINICEAPLFVFSPKLREKIPPLLQLDPRKVALSREKVESRGRGSVGQDHSENDNIRVEEWVLITLSISIFLTESRLIVFLYNLVSLSLTIMILKGIEISTDFLTLLLIAMLPYYVGSTLIPILYIGKRLNLTDEDFRIVFLSWLSKPNAYCRPTSEPMQEVHPPNQEEARRLEPGEYLLRAENEADSLDDISMPSEECIADFFDESIYSDHESEKDDELIQIVIEDAGSTIGGDNARESDDNSNNQQISEQLLNGPDSHAEFSSVNVSEEDCEPEHKSSVQGDGLHGDDSFHLSEDYVG